MTRPRRTRWIPADEPPPALPDDVKWIDAWVQLHRGSPGSDGTKNPARVPRVKATRVAVHTDDLGRSEYWVEAHWNGLTEVRLTDFTLWDSQEGGGFVATGTLPEESRQPTLVRDGSLSLSSFPDGFSFADSDR